MKKIAVGAAVLVFVGLTLAAPVRAEEASTNVCDRLETAWQSKLAAYERAKKIRVTAFEKTKVRWNSLIAKIETTGVLTTVVKVDASDVASKFDALIAADDALMAAMKNYGKVVCDKGSTVDARKELKNAQDGRKLAHQAYVKSLRQLAIDLAKFKTSSK